jgi:hypothetical protein
VYTLSAWIFCDFFSSKSSLRKASASSAFCLNESRSVSSCFAFAASVMALHICMYTYEFISYQNMYACMYVCIYVCIYIYIYIYIHTHIHIGKGRDSGIMNTKNTRIYKDWLQKIHIFDMMSTGDDMRIQAQPRHTYPCGFGQWSRDSASVIAFSTIVCMFTARSAIDFSALILRCSMAIICVHVHLYMYMYMCVYVSVWFYVCKLMCDLYACICLHVYMYI